MCQYIWEFELVRVPDFAIANSSRRHFSVGGLPPHPHPPALQWGGSAPPHHSEKSAFGLIGRRSLIDSMGPWAHMALDQDWTWSYLAQDGFLRN